MFENKESSDVLININKNQKTKKIKSMLNKLFDFEIKQIKNYEVLKLNKIKEYNFELERLQIELIDNTKIELYFKIISKVRIKESLFCFYNLILENLENTKNSNDFFKRVSITELNNYKERKAVELNNVLEDKRKIEIQFIEKTDLEKENVSIQINSEQMLFVGIIK